MPARREKRLQADALLQCLAARHLDPAAAGLRREAGFDERHRVRAILDPRIRKRRNRFAQLARDALLRNLSVDVRESFPQAFGMTSRCAPPERGAGSIAASLPR